ncbi:hypothetical protein [Acaryochloris marina]|uniref:Uncharacterized protein n=1 Tax=Acaryochloris marina (strain MBIC 11017) TaxID=329726 RepID=B0C3Q6_ACAM1|nr:hypothetical protein [Acaryochloris marina]ABW30993.1 hypothetical protein AM1_6061 [Acaryochloris marina MBIC11017]BDM79716.1 hypothetical protein AM10699_25840 [Acaryochloris marina MBIC10699]
MMPDIFDYILGDRYILPLLALTVVSFLLSVQHFYNTNTDNSEYQSSHSSQAASETKTQSKGGWKINLLFIAGGLFYLRVVGNLVGFSRADFYLDEDGLSGKAGLLLISGYYVVIFFIILARRAGEWLSKRLNNQT